MSDSMGWQFAPAFIVPAMLVSHILVFVFLMRHRTAADRRLQPPQAGCIVVSGIRFAVGPDESRSLSRLPLWLLDS